MLLDPILDFPRKRQHDDDDPRSSCSRFASRAGVVLVAAVLVRPRYLECRIPTPSSPPVLLISFCCRLQNMRSLPIGIIDAEVHMDRWAELKIESNPDEANHLLWSIKVICWPVPRRFSKSFPGPSGVGTRESTKRIQEGVRPGRHECGGGGRRGVGVAQTSLSNQS